MMALSCRNNYMGLPRGTRLPFGDFFLFASSQRATFSNDAGQRLLVSDIIEELTVCAQLASEKILIAASFLDKKGQSPFSAEALIVASWQHFPKTFGLKGYADLHPDSNKVLSSIMGERGLAKRGLLVKMGQKLYALTKEGRREVARLTQEEQPESTKSVQLSKDKEKFLQFVFTSSAVRKFEENQKQDLTFADACRFWDITQNLKGEAVDTRLQYVDQMLNELDQILAQEDAELPTGRVVTAGDLRALRNIHHYMEDRFERVLNLLRSRTTKK
jgi:hypothetical protein